MCIGLKNRDFVAIFIYIYIYGARDLALVEQVRYHYKFSLLLTNFGSEIRPML